MKLRIGIGQDKRETLWVDGYEYHQVTPYSVQVSCLREAQLLIEQELNKTAGKLNGFTFGAYMWCYTVQHYRGENIDGLYRSLFLVELVKYWKSQNSELKLDIYVGWNEALLKEFSKAGVSLNVKFFSVLQRRMNRKASFLYRNWLSFRRQIKAIFARNHTHPETDVLIDINRSPDLHRLGDLKDYQGFGERIGYFSGQQYLVQGFPCHSTVAFINEISYKDWLWAFREMIKIYRFKKVNRSRISHFLYPYLSPLVDLRLLDLILFKRGCAIFFERSKVKYIFQVSTLNQPNYRILMASAMQYGVRFCLIASRTLKQLSCSDYYLKCDLSGYSGTAIPYNYVVRDTFSKKVLEAKSGIQDVMVGSRIPRSTPEEGKLTQSNTGFTILVLLTHIREVSEEILKICDNLGLHQRQVQRVLVKPHPSCSFSASELNAYAYLPNVQLFVGKSYAELNDQKHIVIAGPTTAALEALNAGGLLLWLPFVWSDGILFNDIMNVVGEKCESEEIARSAIHEMMSYDTHLLRSRVRRDQEAVKEWFTTECLISDCVKKLVS